MAEPAPLIERVPPHSLEAEQSTLGSMLLSRSALEQGLEMLRSDDFYRGAHRHVFDAMADLSARDEPADTLTIAEELRRMGRLDAIGGTDYLFSLVNSVPTAAHIDYYGRIVEQHATLRRLIEVADEMTQTAYAAQDPVDEIVDRAERLVFGVARGRTQQPFTHLRPLLFEANERLEQLHDSDETITGMPTGFPRLNEITTGFQRGDMIIIAGRPSMGKTALALNIAVNLAADRSEAVALFSLEMSKSQLVQRMMCSEARVDANRLRSGRLREDSADGENDWVKIARAVGRLGELPIFIDDTSDISVMEMRAKCRRLRAEHGLALIVVDYLQLVRGSGRAENRTQEISAIARHLKGLARELDVPLMALSQLSRNVEHRDDKRPRLSDLRESGSIEAEADLVGMLYRPKYYDHGSDGDDGSNDPDWADDAELIIAKHRNGPTGVVPLVFLRRYARFESRAEGYREF